MHPGTVGVENPDHPDIDPVLAVIIEKEGLCATFSLIIARPYPDGIDISPVILLLRMDCRVAIDFAGGGLKDLGLDPLGNAQHVDSPHDVGLYGFDRVILIVDGGRGTGQIIYLIHFKEYGMNQVVAYQFKIGPADEMTDISLVAGKEIVQAEDFMAIFCQTFT